MDNNFRAGDSNRVTREYFDSLLIEMRHIDAVLPNTRMKLYGENFDTPVMTAALSHLNNIHKDGMVELARGAKLANAVMWAGMGDYDELEQICATGAKVIKIIKPYADNDEIFRKIAHAEENGCIAVGIDTDHAYNQTGGYDVIHDLKMSGKTLDEIKQFVKATKLPFIIKGVLSVQDALKCMEAGIQGVVVSHHHGIMEYAVPPLVVLPKIVQALRGTMPIFVDCSVESGFDAFKAIALGATAVSAGRALMGPLGENGAEGVKQKILAMNAQLAGTMTRTCSRDITTIDSTLIYRL